MKIQRTAFSVLVATALLLAPATIVVRAQTSGDFFDSSKLQEVRLFLNSKDLAALRANFLLNTKYPADLQWKNIRAHNISVRSRGFGSRSQQKLGLEISFDHYTPTQTFLGLHQLVLRNLWQDPTFLHEQLAMELFARMGQPASREAFARVFINNVDQGVYSLVEDVDADFVSRTLGQTGGYLFEYHWLFAYYATLLEDTAYGPALFEPRTHDTDPAFTLYPKIRDIFLFAATTGPDDAWLDRVNTAIDIRQLIQYVAIENFLGEWDGWTGNFGMNNFYLYRPAGSTQHRIFTWDRSEAFTGLDTSAFIRTNENVLISRALAIPELKTLYLDTLEACANSAAQDGWLEGEINRYVTLITDAVHADTHKQFSNDAYDSGIQYLIDFARRRPGIVLQEVAQNR